MIAFLVLLLIPIALLIERRKFSERNAGRE